MEKANIGFLTKSPFREMRHDSRFWNWLVPVFVDILADEAESQ
jgi:hypothetical protein